MFEKWKKSKQRLSDPIVQDEAPEIPEGINKKLSENIITLREMFGASFDLIIKEAEVNTVKIAFVALDGMYDGLHASQSVVEPVLNTDFSHTDPKKVYDHLCRR